MKIENIKNGRDLKKWRELRNIPRYVFAAKIGKAINTIHTIERTGRVLDDNFKIILKAKYK